MTDKSALLKAKCHTYFTPWQDNDLAEDLRQMAAWCDERKVRYDVYGEGEFIRSFERRIAELLGYEAAVFAATGTMAQQVALRIAHRDKAGAVAMHGSAHVYRHEREAYQRLHDLPLSILGNMHTLLAIKDISGHPEPISTLLYELPMREIGGQLLSWDQLEMLKEHCQQQGIHLHMDGARLWECGPGYNKSYQEICQGFDSAYVSLYKGIGGWAGSMLCGTQAFIDEASYWLARHGGNQYRRTPYVVSAAMKFDTQLGKMPAYCMKAKQVAECLQANSVFQLNPVTPQVNMMHVHFPVKPERANQARDQIAEELGIWLFNAAHPNQTGNSYIEISVGDGLLEANEDLIRTVFNRFGELIA